MYRLMRGVALAGAFAVLGSCAVGAPLGFSSGDSWSFPLVAPLEDSQYLVPVWIKDKGPYLFMIDPDAPVSSLDNAIQSDLDLYTTRGPEQLDERDHLVPTALAEVPKIRIGDSLTIEQLKMHVHKVGTYQSAGRLVRGILGRDVIADSLIFAADRDHGMAYLATQGHYAPPTDGHVITYRISRPEPEMPRRNLTQAEINGHQVQDAHRPGRTPQPAVGEEDERARVARAGGPRDHG